MKSINSFAHRKCQQADKDANEDRYSPGCWGWNGVSFPAAWHIKKSFFRSYQYDLRNNLNDKQTGKEKGAYANYYGGHHDTEMSGVN